MIIIKVYDYSTIAKTNKDRERVSKPGLGYKGSKSKQNFAEVLKAETAKRVAEP